MIESCGHKYHKSCLIPSIKGAINKGNSKVGCLSNGCNSVISNEEIFELLGDKYSAKLKLLERPAASKTQYMNSNAELSCCPNPSCNYKFHYNGQSDFTCPACLKKYCLDCRVEYHLHTGSCSDI
mmetsp:Transcript_41557/g.36921  ORF Transcript_41557/g.36921 Transcript_41557/m.36921 type:complete len:125 (-) Transcript_41557:552-926(-)